MPPTIEFGWPNDRNDVLRERIEVLLWTDLIGDRDRPGRR